MKIKTVTAYQLLAAYWLFCTRSEDAHESLQSRTGTILKRARHFRKERDFAEPDSVQNENKDTPRYRLRLFAEDRGFTLADADLQTAADQLEGGLTQGDVGLWVVQICFRGHPHFLWNFMIDALAFAETDGDLETIAAELAEHILSHYGSMIPYFEHRAHKKPRFRRMLTGVWRHRMSDNVWMRLRALQADVPEPLSNMIPLEFGKDYKADSMSSEDRLNDDKGRYRRDADGRWKTKR